MKNDLRSGTSFGCGAGVVEDVLQIRERCRREKADRLTSFSIVVAARAGLLNQAPRKWQEQYGAGRPQSQEKS
jgi:hypothetical protein